jgi:hypothetical protein
MFADYFHATILTESGPTGDIIKVAKPYNLRNSRWSGQRIVWSHNFTVEYTYTYPSDPVRRAHRVETDETFFERVWIPYTGIRRGEHGTGRREPIVWALKVGEAVTRLEGVDYLDMNVDSRLWVEL